MNRVSRPASRSGPLATAISDTCVSPNPSKISLTALSWPRPPSMMTRSGHCGNESSSGLGLGAVALSRRQQPLEAPLQHLAHHRVIVARRQAFGLDVELAVLVFDEAVRPGHDHGADRVGALDMAVVIDLDPPRRMRQPERGGHALQQPALGRGIGELAAERLAGIGERVRDQFLLFAALAASRLPP